MPEYECCHEELIQTHSLEIKELQTEVKFKKEKIDTLTDNIEDMDKKIDKIAENVNNLMLKSINDDKDIDKRVTSLETTVKVIKWGLTLLFGSGIVWLLLTYLPKLT